MIANDYMSASPLLLLTTAEIAVTLPTVFVVRYFYVRLYPPRRMIVIYGEHSPEELISKINSRKISTMFVQLPAPIWDMRHCILKY